MNDWLHEELTFGYKVVLNGHDFPAPFCNGDILDVFNSMPDDSGCVLLKRQGKHQVKLFREDLPFNFKRADIVGCIDSFKRSVLDDLDLFLGDESDREYVPQMCSGCERVEVIESAGNVDAYCQTSEG